MAFKLLSGKVELVLLNITYPIHFVKNNKFQFLAQPANALNFDEENKKTAAFEAPFAGHSGGRYMYCVRTFKRSFGREWPLCKDAAGLRNFDDPNVSDQRKRLHGSVDGVHDADDREHEQRQIG